MSYNVLALAVSIVQWFTAIKMKSLTQRFTVTGLFENLTLQHMSLEVSDTYCRLHMCTCTGTM